MFNINKARLNKQPCQHFNDHRLQMGFTASRTRSKEEATELHQRQSHFHQRFPSFLALFFVSAFGPRDELAEGSPMWPHLLNTRMEVQTRRVHWPALRRFVKEHEKRRPDGRDLLGVSASRSL